MIDQRLVGHGHDGTRIVAMRDEGGVIFLAFTPDWQVWNSIDDGQTWEPGGVGDARRRRAMS